jgi:hypothetical protein
MNPAVPSHPLIVHLPLALAVVLLPVLGAAAALADMNRSGGSS